MNAKRPLLSHEERSFLCSQVTSPLCVTPCLECYSTEGAVNEDAVNCLEVELTCLLRLQLDGEEVVRTIVEESVVATVHESGVEGLLTVRVETVVSEVHHVLHTYEFYAHIFEFSSVFLDTIMVFLEEGAFFRMDLLLNMRTSLNRT